MTRLFTLLILLAALRAECQTNLLPPPPSPTVISNLQHRLQAPANQCHYVVIDWDYTNVVFPVESSTDLVTWVSETNVVTMTMTVRFPVTNTLPYKFYRVGQPTYYGSWSVQTN